MVTEKNDKSNYKPKSSRLSAIPKDVYDMILEAQLQQKQKCNCQYSIEQTIYLMIRKLKRENVKD